MMGSRGKTRAGPSVDSGVGLRMSGELARCWGFCMLRAGSEIGFLAYLACGLAGVGEGVRTVEGWTVGGRTNCGDARWECGGWRVWVSPRRGRGSDLRRLDSKGGLLFWEVV